MKIEIYKYLPLKKNVKAKLQDGQGYFEHRQIFVKYSVTNMMIEIYKKLPLRGKVGKLL